jgi:hypothetical protein
MSSKKTLCILPALLFLTISLVVTNSVFAQTCTDNDQDSYAVEGGSCGPVDCDDNDAGVHPGAVEICDGKDTNCDGSQSLTDRDKDSDGVAWCAGDCNDNDPNVYPGAVESCNGIDDDCNGSLPPDERDSDGDGYRLCDAVPDCNDFDPLINPGASEVCSDSKDNNCDGNIDEAACVCPDNDNDGHQLDLCGGDDCDDGNPTAYTGATEDCTDGIDNDCDGLIDRLDPDAVNCPTCTDQDGDGYAVDGGSCGQIDCDDNDPNVHPGAAEICDGKDTNCDGSTSMTDVDADGDGVAWCGGDCNDSDPAVYPGAPELCNGLDDDCNGSPAADERDSDGDGFLLCDPVPDCDDFDPSVNPAAVEICSDGLDNNCDGNVDEAACVCPDADGDGQTNAVCGGTDCDDSNPNVFLGATEDCTDGIDNDCDGLIDLADPDAVNCPSCTDLDGDGYATEGGLCGPVDCDDSDPSVNPGAVEICDGKDTNCDGSKPATDVDADGDGVAWCANDCNDNDPNIYPGAPELCDGVDNDCNGILRGDEHDADGDGYRLCDAVPDCNDFDASINPGAQELCQDGKDNNCDGQIDGVEGIDCVCPDADGDGWTTCAGDCDDSNANIYPGATEICSDGIDNNCDGLIDLQDEPVCLAGCIDGDLDGYKDAACGGSDCDDTNFFVNPGMAEICDGLDTNCDGTKPQTDVDADGDGVPWCAGDCDDNDPDVYPGNTEGPFGDPTCSDGIDNDCNTQVDAADGSCAPPTCQTRINPKDGPHMFDLLNKADDSVIKSPCQWCHWDNSGLVDQRVECQRCHADSTDPSDPLNGVLRDMYPLNPPYGFGTAPIVKVHSSTTLGNKYGNWSLHCLNCHNPHLEEQNLRYGTSYGKLIKEYICMDNQATGEHWESTVVFTNSIGAGSFADGPPHDENICETCHTRTNHHRRDGTAPGDLDANGNYIGHNDNKKCTNCHSHATGFSPAGALPQRPHNTQFFYDNCQFCHVSSSSGVLDYAIKIPASQCQQCHGERHEHTSDLTRNPDASGKYVYDITCVDCHASIVMTRCLM